MNVAGNLTMTAASGSIASTLRPMALYVRMILNRGKVSNRRIVSEDAFKPFVTPYIPAADFGSTASYGYGIAVDTVDGHTRLTHTGDMVSFVSAMQIDIQSGCAAFASINAEQDHAPNPVVQYALQLMRADQEGNALSSAPAFDDNAMLEDAAAYGSVYRGGRTVSR